MESNVRQGYNQWAESYDSVHNKTRDLDKHAMQFVLQDASFAHLLEIGCGTGKNSEWLVKISNQLTSVDFSENMISKARAKVKEPNVHFVQADITSPWPFADASFDAACCNLILEHIADLDFVFSEAARVLQSAGRFYISELHPVKQYLGSKARFELNDTTQVLDCFVHHASDFFNCALKNGLACRQFNEWFDEENQQQPPRLLTMAFEKI